MPEYKIPSASTLADGQFIEIAGPDGVITGYQYDANSRALYFKESQVIIPSFHGVTHISSDPIPNATTSLPGLLSADDKAKLDQLLQMKIGVLGYCGAGFSDDNGFLTGEVILASDSEFITLEKIGNVVRISSNFQQTPQCGAEECAQLFWVLDETDVTSIRPPSCAGKLPGVNTYGELKVYLFPETTLVNPSNPATTLNKKASYPAFLFRRYSNSITPGLASVDCILQRNSNGTTKVGWSMVPGATGKPESVWFMGSDNDGKQIRFDLDITKEPKLLGQLLYQGHSITKQMGVIVDYSPTVVSTNQYLVKFWSINNKVAIGNSFTSTNVWRYNNPLNSSLSLSSPQQMVLDSTVDILPIGTLVELWEFKIGETKGTRITASYFSKEPQLTAASLWSASNIIRFGDTLQARTDMNDQNAYLSPTVGSDRADITANETTENDLRLTDRSTWGITGFDDPLYLADDGISTNGGVTIKSDTVFSISFGTLLQATSPEQPQPNCIIVAAKAVLGGTSAFEPNGLVGRILVWNTGVLAGTEYRIIDNTASTITILSESLGGSNGDMSGVLVGDAFYIYSPSTTGEPSGVAVNNQYVAMVDTDLPGLRVVETVPQADRERPVFLWDRKSHKNVYTKLLFGQPDSSRFPPIDILLRAPVDSFEERYVKVIRRGKFTTLPYENMYYIVVKGLHWRDLPKSGSIRLLTGLYRNYIWKYSHKLAFDRYDSDAVVLVTDTGIPFPFDADYIPMLQGTGEAPGGEGTEAANIINITVPLTTTVCEVLHLEYTCPAVRLEFSIDETTGQNNVQLQVRAGILSMAQAYEFDLTADPSDETVRGFLPGSFSISKIHTQVGFITTGTETVSSDPADFKIYSGGTIPTAINGETELWNTLEILLKDNQIWVWVNGLMVTPSSTLSAALPVPPLVGTAVVNTPYFPIFSTNKIGKVALRMWPGAKIREFEVKSQESKFSEFSYGQLEVTS